jgi:heterotetrameric sarcosine oxidase delta subunit
MIMLPCPWCGQRNVSEFHYLGEPASRPDPNQTTPREWKEYLYIRANAAGWQRENWFHRAGCRQYFSIERNTVSNEIRTNEIRTNEIQGVDR